MNTIRRLVLEHRAAIVLAVLSSLIAAAPQVYFRIDNQDILKEGVQRIELLPDSPWSARAREVQDGHPWFGNIYNKDGKDNPYLFQPLGSMVVGYMGETFSLDINDTLLLSRLVLTGAVVVLIYIFVFLFSRSKPAALASAAVLVLADSILSYYGVNQLLHGLSPDNFLRISRPVNPAMIYVLFFGFLIPFWLYYRGKDWRYGALSALVLGLNFYNYFYTWTYLYAFGGIIVLFLLFEKKWREALRISAVFVGALPIALLYLINLHNVTLHPAYEEVGARFGVVLTHAPLFVGFTVITALLVYLLGFVREDKSRYYFGLALLLTPFVTMNQQLITGKILQPAHYHWFFHKPMAVVLVLVVVFHLTSRLKNELYKKLLAILIVTTCVFVGIFTQAESYKHDSRDGLTIAIERQKYGPVMDWLNAHAEKEAVVFGNDETSHLTVVYTPLNVYDHRAAPFASLSATKARQTETMFTYYRLQGVQGSNVEEVFFKDRRHISGRIYGIYYRELFGSYEAIPDEKIDEMVTLYRDTLSTPTAEWLKNTWQKYDVEYVVWDEAVDPNWELSQYAFLRKVGQFGGVAIYYFDSWK